MNKIPFLIIHNDTPISLTEPNGGAEMATLFLARTMAAQGNLVTLAARFKDKIKSEDNLTYFDLGAAYDIEKILKHQSAQGKYYLISKSNSLAVLLSKNDSNCLARVVVADEPPGGLGLKIDVVSQIADRIICVSESLKSKLIMQGADPAKCSVVYNGVDLNLFTPGSKKRDENRLVFAGALVPDKGIHFLIEAFASLKVKYPQLKLDVYGSAKLWNREDFINTTDLQKRIPDLKFHGAVPQVDLVEHFQNSGLCVAPSIWDETFGMVAADALASGCPVVTFNVGGLSEVVIDGVNGSVLKEITPQGLIKGLDVLLADPKKISRLRAGALQNRTRFDWNKSAQAIQNICKESANNKIESNTMETKIIERSDSQQNSSSNMLKSLSAPMISVITVSYNQGQFIRDTIESILAQGYKNFEHIIIDGGSTDNTLDILKEYPHLNWVSERDRGQSHALNKGFKRAKGDIIVWLNSDDFLAPDCFQKIIPALEHNNTVIAPAAKTDRYGKVEEIIPNIERTHLDILKFWVPQSWLAQVSVFFRRDFLETVKLPNGDYLDEDLYYTMDVDLWLRMSNKENFSNRIDSVCSYFRMYEENKTGEDGPAAQRECSRLFRRYSGSNLLEERRYSIIMSVSEIDERIMSSIDSISKQSVQDIEIILVGYGNKVDQKSLRKFAKTIDEKIPPYCIRSAYCDDDKVLAAYNHALNTARGKFCIFINSGEKLSHDFISDVERSFVYDWVGVSLPLSDKPSLQQELCIGGDSTRPTLDGIFAAHIFSPTMVARSATLRDLGGFKTTSSTAIGVRELMLRALYKSWHVLIDRPIAIQNKHVWREDEEFFKKHATQITAKMIVDLADESQSDKFLQVKLAHGNGIKFGDQLVANARELLQRSDPTWITEDVAAIT